VGLWEDMKTGERKRIINSDVVAGKTITAGRLKKKRYAEYIEGAKAAMWYTDIENLDPDLLEAARLVVGSDVDSTGRRVAKTRIVNGIYEGENDSRGEPRIYFLNKGVLQCRSVEAKGAFMTVTAELEKGGEIVENEKPAPTGDVELPLEDQLRILIPFLVIRNDIVTFEKVRDLHRVDGKNCRELLVDAGIIDKRLTLTEKGKAWLRPEQSA
jgi:hypothetical protein